MKDEEQICREALAWMLSETPEMYRAIVKSIEGGADYFRQQWGKDFGTIIDVSTFSDEEIIDATFAINQLRMSEIRKEDQIREVARIPRIKPQLLN